jgi:hypothetical protein
MKLTRYFLVTCLVTASLTAGSLAQTDGTSKPAPANSAPAATQSSFSAADFQALKDAISSQQQQIQALQNELHRRDQAVQQAQSAAENAAAKADAAQSQTSALQNDLADFKLVGNTASNGAVFKNALLTSQDAGQTSNPQPEQVYNKAMESAVTIRFKGINITPGGYAAAEFVRRSRALSADLPTPFNSLVMPGSSQAQVSEFFGSGRQSKTTVFVDGRVGNVDLSSYVSADFLSAGVTSTPTSTNSYTLRLRQAWAQAKFDNGWSFLGGQSWSLVTENGKGIAPDDDMGKTNDARPKTIDPSYNVGFNFARQFGLRLTKSFGEKVAVAVAIENPQATLTTHGNASNFLLGQAGASNSYNTTATYSFNPSPDIIAKVAFDPGFGHYEVFGLTDRFTDRIFPCVENFKSTACGSGTSPNALLAYNKSKEGGGVGASARWTFANRVTFGLKGFGGSGIGRYAPGGLSDAAINPDGSLHLIKGYQGLGTLELKATRKLDLYSYGGVEYASRTWGVDNSSGKPVIVGYGAPGFNNTGCYSETVPGSGGFAPGSLSNCTGDTRALIEGTVGFWYRFYSGPKGRFQYGTQYSYLTRNTWSGAGGLPAGSAGRQPNGLDSMVFSSFRYYLP